MPTRLLGVSGRLGALLVAIVAAAPFFATAPLSAGEPRATATPTDPAALALQREVARLRVERQLAAGKGFYLRLDVARQRLALMLQGVALDEYAASALAIGVPEVFFVDRRPGAGWDEAAITGGRLEPERQRDRLEIVAPPPDAAASARGDREDEAEPSPPPVPKSAEEAYSVPSPYRVVFAEGVSLEVRSQGGGGRNRGLLRRAVDAVGLRVADLGSALGLGSRDRVRLRLTLDADDAAALYRSLPPDVGLVVVGVGPR